MKKDIILSGVGGQGILSIATVIGKAALDAGLSIKQAEVHGMSQRGGDVQSNLRIASGEIASDLIARGVADIIISLEPLEALRYLPWLSKEGWVITNTAPLINIPNYPEAEAANSTHCRTSWRSTWTPLPRARHRPAPPTSYCWVQRRRFWASAPRSSKPASAPSSPAKVKRS